MKPLQFFFCSFLILTALLPLQGKNLLPGDTGVETEWGSVTNGPYGIMIYGRGEELAHWTDSESFEGKRSLLFRRFGGCSTVPSRPLKKGKKYTFSFYAKASREGVKGWINCPHNGLSVYPDPAGAKVITFGTAWKRYTYTFTAQQNRPHTGFYKVLAQNAKVFFDAFQLEEGEKATPYAPQKNIISGITVKAAPGGIYYKGDDPQIRIGVRRFSGKAEGPVKVWITDQKGKTIAEYAFTPRFDAQGFYSHALDFIPPKAGYYKVRTELAGEKASRQFVVTEKVSAFDPAVMPFSSFCNMSIPDEILWRLGSGWMNFCHNFDYCAATPGKINIWGVETLRRSKKRGLKIKLMINLNPPKRFLTREEREAQKTHRLGDARFMPPDSSLGEWKTFMEELVRQCGDLIDIWEFGGELDARFGLNTYYKEKYASGMKGPFVTGKVTEQVAKFTRIGSQIIRKRYPDAMITAVRPCDVDCRSNFIFSSEVYKGLKGAANCFALDSYTHPRRIGKGQSVTGEVTDLISQYEAARKVLHLADPESNAILISEFGYELLADSEDDPVYQNLYADCYAQSNLMARAINFGLLAYYTGLSGGGIYDHWRKNEPLPSVAAICYISRFLRDVDKAEYTLPADGIVTAIFRKSNGQAAGAFFSCNPEDEPECIIPARKLTDIYGEQIQPAVKNGSKIRTKITYSPVLFHAKDWNDAKKILQNMEIIISNPLLAELRMRTADTVKLYLTSRLKKESIRVLFRHRGRKYEYIIPANKTVIADLEIAPGQKELALTLEYPEKNKKIQQKFNVPPLYTVPKLAKPFPVDAQPEKWAKYKKMEFTSKSLIYPIDVFSWYGPEDLSCTMNLAHDGKYFYVFTAVRDDLHCNKYKGADLANGDLLQLAWDPLTNTAGLAKDKKRGDDSNIALGLSSGKKRSLFYYGPDQKLFEKSLFAVRRSEKEKITYYEIRIPLEVLQIRKEHVFGFSAVAFDDDSNTRWAYYMNLFPGITRGNDPSLYGQFILE